MSGTGNLREASREDSEPPVVFGYFWGSLDSYAVCLAGSHGERELDNSEDDGEDQNSAGPGLSPELLEDRVGKIRQDHRVESSEDDCAEEFGVLYDLLIIL